MITRTDKIKLLESLLYIDNKEGIVVPFKLNKVQRYFQENKSNRNIVLKHRQGGMSSCVLADMFTDCLVIPHTQCAVVSHETRSTQRLLDRVQFFYNLMSEPKPLLGAESRSEKTFPELHSSIYIGTAGARAFGHGDTIRKALMSELALYEDGEKVLNGVEDAVPHSGEINIECYDERTEVLTDRGWLYFKDTLLTDKVLSKNLVTNKAYWSKVTSKVEHPATELIHVTGKGIDFAVTPNHSIWARKSGTIQSFKTYQAKELFDYSEWEFDTNLVWEGEEIPFSYLEGVSIPMDLWLEYLGYFLSEGSVSDSYVIIFQDGEYTELFKEASRKVALYFGKESKEYNNKDFRINDIRLVRYLSNYTKPKRFPKELLNLSKRQLSILLNSYMKGDGEKKRNRCVTKDIPLRDGIQEIGLKLGYRTNYFTRKAKGIHKESYTISFYKRSKPSVRLARGQVNKEPYSGLVYCLSIPENHLLMVRRNGKVCWLQNCTPNGEDNIFYQKWIRAKEGKSPYKPFFFPWWWSEDYSLPRGCSFVLPVDREELSFSGEELELIGRHHLTEDQIRWRRWKIGEKEGLFWQEYPEDEVSCFITVGDPVFDQFVLTAFAQDCYGGERHKQGWTFWLPPKEKVSYIVGADSSAGAPGGSYSAAVVLSDKWEVCATFQARVEPHTFAGILKQLGMWYNNAELAVERNFTGYAVLGHLVGYPNLYHQRDFLTGKVTSNLGWWTNEQTKQYMHTALKDHLSQLKLWDINLVRQLRGYRYIKFRPTAQTFDDLAVALMIAVATRKVSSGARGYRGNIAGWSW